VLEIEAANYWDLATTALLFWVAIAWLRRSQAQAVLLGVGALGAAYLLTRTFGLQLASGVLGTAVVASLAACIVMFHGEIRSAFERILHWRKAPSPQEHARVVLAESIAKMAETHTGALLVFPRRRPIEPHIHGGVVLDALISQPLLLSLFDPTSPGHDGALIVRGDRLECFAVHLPLSTHLELLEGHGTRHSSALGLSERCDACCIVVSEERGTVTVARDGALEEVRPEGVLGLLTEICTEQRSRRGVPRKWTHAGEAFAAVLLTLLAWWIFVPGSQRTTSMIRVPLHVENVPDGYEARTLYPDAIALTLSGPRRDLLLLTPENVVVELDAWSLRFGRRTFTLSEQDVELPAGVEILSMSPRRITLSTRSTASVSAKP
jgi:DNA integrity scanning protein DisA with diadenylate cyclase activity